MYSILSIDQGEFRNSFLSKIPCTHWNYIASDQTCVERELVRDERKRERKVIEDGQGRVLVFYFSLSLHWRALTHSSVRFPFSFSILPPSPTLTIPHDIMAIRVYFLHTFSINSHSKHCFQFIYFSWMSTLTCSNFLPKSNLTSYDNDRYLLAGK